MLITFKKANQDFKNLLDKFQGVRYGRTYRAYAIKGKIVIMRHRTIVLTIDRLNNYEFCLKGDRDDLNFLNRSAPIKIKNKNGKWWVGSMPFYVGMKVDKLGELIIPEAWPGDSQLHSCQHCRVQYTNRLCDSCYDDLISDELDGYNEGVNQW